MVQWERQYQCNPAHSSGPGCMQLKETHWLLQEPAPLGLLWLASHWSAEGELNRWQHHSGLTALLQSYRHLNMAPLEQRSQGGGEGSPLCSILDLGLVFV